MLTNTYVSKILEEIRQEAYLGLHFDNPELAGHYASEISGGGYLRQKAVFTEPASRNIWLEQAVAYQGLLAARVGWVGCWNSLKDGDLVAVGKLPQPYTILNGGGIQLVPGDVVLSIV